MEDELNWSLFIFELMGLQYFSIKTLSYDSLKNRITLYRFIYMVFLLTFVLTFVVAFVMAENYMVIESLTVKNVLMFTIKNSMNVGLVLVVCSSLIQSYSSTNYVMQIYLNTREISQLCFEEFKVFIDFKQVKNSTWKRLSVTALVLSTLHGVVGVIHMKYLLKIYPMLVSLVPMIFFFMIVFKMVFYIDLINIHLEFLEKLIKEVPMDHPIKIIDNINLHLLSVRTVKPVKPPEDTLIKKFRVIRKTYNLIYENGILINDSIGLSVLMLIGSLVIALTASGYEGFVIIVGGLPMEKIPGVLKCVSVI